MAIIKFQTPPDQMLVGSRGFSPCSTMRRFPNFLTHHRPRWAFVAQISSILEHAGEGVPDHNADDETHRRLVINAEPNDIIDQRDSDKPLLREDLIPTVEESEGTFRAHSAGTKFSLKEMRTMFQHEEGNARSP